MVNEKTGKFYFRVSNVRGFFFVTNDGIAETHLLVDGNLLMSSRCFCSLACIIRTPISAVKIESLVLQ